MMRLWLVLIGTLAMTIASKSPKSMRQERHAIGISVGGDYVSAAIATEKRETRFLLRVEGDSHYKSYMRQDLWHRPYRKPRAMESAQINDQLTTVMQAGHGKPPVAKKLRPTFNAMKAKLTKALGQDIFFNIVVGVPLHLSIRSRSEIHAEMHDAGFHVLNTVRQPALASTLFNFRHPITPQDWYTTLVVDYNRASLDLSVTPTANGASDVLAQQSFPNLGEDALDLKVASLIFNETIDGRDWVPLADLAKQIRIQRHRGFDNETNEREIRFHKSKPFDLEGIKQNQLRLDDLNLSSFADHGRFNLFHLINATEVEKEHYLGILIAVNDFVTQHSYNAEHTTSSAWTARLSEKSNMLLSGDADESGFQALRQVLYDSDVDWPLASEQESPVPGQVAARGAAIKTQEKMTLDEDARKAQLCVDILLQDEDLCVDMLLQDEDHRKTIKLVVPHDL